MKIGWSGTSRRPSDPQSGFVSTATTRSRRRDANSDPSSAVTVLLPTPPLGDTTAIVTQERSRSPTISSSSWYW